MTGLRSIRKSGLRLFSIRRSRLVEAPRSAGELEMLVMKYDRRTCERESCANGAIEAWLAFVGCAAGDEVVALEIGSVESVAGFSFGGELCILRRFDSLLLPCWTAYTQQTELVCFCTTLESTVSVRGTRKAGFIMMRQSGELIRNTRETKRDFFTY